MLTRLLPLIISLEEEYNHGIIIMLYQYMFSSYLVQYIHLP